MELRDIKIRHMKKSVIFVYMDDENTKIKEVKIKGKTLLENSGYYLIPGKIKINDGTVYPAILGISSDDAGEMFEAYFFVNEKWLSQMDKQFLKKISKGKNQVFPFKYHLSIKVKGDRNLLHQF